METTQLTERVTRAISIATGAVAADPSERGHTITGAKKDLNCKGRGDEWYRMVLRNGRWQYVSDDRLPSGSFRASDRRASVSGDVYVGEIVVRHPRGGRVESAWLVCDPGEDGKVLVGCGWGIRRDGQASVRLPDGQEVVVEDPRKK